MSSIQQGIQAAHAQMEMFVKYQQPEDLTLGVDEQVMLMENQTMLFDWAENHKTMICLNAGDHNGLVRAQAVMEMIDNRLPWASFYEEPGAIAEAQTLTNVCAIIPEKYYELARNMNKMMRNHDRYDFDWGEDGSLFILDKYNEADSINLEPCFVQLVNILSECRLAG